MLRSTSSCDRIARYCDSGVVWKRKWAMKISYKKLWILLAEQEITKMELREGAGIAPNTMTKLNQEKEVSLSILLKICDYLDCNIGDICDAIKE